MTDIREEFARKADAAACDYAQAGRSGGDYAFGARAACEQLAKQFRSHPLPSVCGGEDVAAMREALAWIANIADMTYEQDEKLRHNGARALKRISDRAQAALSSPSPPVSARAESIRNAIAAMEEIERLAFWHCDEDADPENESPEDNVAHINGLIVSTAREALAALKREVGDV